MCRRLRANDDADFYASAYGYSSHLSGLATFLESDEEKQAVHGRLSTDVRALYPDIHANGFSVFHLERGVARCAEGYGPYVSVPIE